MICRQELLGVQVDPRTISELNDCIVEACDLKEHWIIANHNVHSVYLYHHDAKMRRFFSRAKVIHVDGMALVFLGRMLGQGFTREHRVTYVDWVQPLLQKARENNWRVYYLGGEPGVAERAAQILRGNIQGLRLKVRDGYFDVLGAGNDTVLADIREFRPHILMIGMGMPRQEHWILNNLEELEAHAILTAGACFDYVAGSVPTPPRWLARLGFEWLFRLCSEPKRLWRRYLIEPWFVLGLLLRDLRRHRTKA